MPSTWAGTSASQLITRSALQDAVNGGYCNLKAGASITGTTQICTTGYLNSVISFLGFNANVYPDNRCPTKLAFQNAILRNFRFYASAPSGYEYTLKVEIWRNGSYYSQYSAGINSTSCNNVFTFGYYVPSDTVKVFFSTSLYANVQGRVVKNSTSCGGGTAQCPSINFTNFQDDVQDIKFACQVVAPIVDCGV